MFVIGAGLDCVVAFPAEFRTSGKHSIRIRLPGPPHPQLNYLPNRCLASLSIGHPSGPSRAYRIGYRIEIGRAKYF